MPIKNKIYNFVSKDKKGKIKNNGKMEIKSQADGTPELYFYGDITGSSLENWQDEDKCPQDVSDFLSQLDGENEINIYINSGGGDSFAGLAIYNMLKRNPATKNVFVDGVAASSASLIAMAGDTITIPNTAELMIHNAWTIVMGNANDLRNIISALDKVDESMLNIYMENVNEGITSEQVQEMMDNTTWMNGSDASKIFNNIKVKDMQVSACADSQYYSHYKNLPDILKSKNNNDNKNFVTKEYFDSKITEITKLISGIKLPSIKAGVSPDNISTNKAPDDATWSKPALKDFTDKNWGDLSDQEKKDIAGHYAWAAEMPPNTFGDLKFPHHDPKSGDVVLAGVENCASRLNQADISDDDVSKVKQHLAAHYRQFGKVAPWEQDGTSNSKEIEKLKAKIALECEL